MRDVKTTTLQGYNKKYGSDEAAPLYVLNNSDGRLAFNNRDSQGMSTVLIPMSYAPIDITSLCERDSIIKNSSFRRFLASGRLIIIDNDDFENMLNEDEDLLEEYQKINKIESNAGNDSVQIDLDRDKASEQKEVLVADNEDPCENSTLSSIVRESETLKDDEDTSRLGELKKMFKRKQRNFSKEDLEKFVKVVNSQALRDLALNRLNSIEENEKSKK